jgi:excisionase family DNA binding protein
MDAPPITAKQLAAQVNFDPKTIREWAKRKIIPGARKLGGHWRFPANSADRLMGIRPGK